MTNGLGIVHSVIRKVGGIRRLILILMVASLGTTFLLDVFVVERIFDPLVYLYIVLGTVASLYIIYPLYANKRLTKYYWERMKRNRLAVCGLGFILFLIPLALIGPFFTADPTAVSFEEKNFPPLGFTIEESVFDAETGQFITKLITATGAHPLGTDNKGRDLLAMIISGAKISLQVGLLATGIALAIGTLIGVISAYLGGKMDNALREKVSYERCSFFLVDISFMQHRLDRYLLTFPCGEVINDVNFVAFRTCHLRNMRADKPGTPGN